jgi:outer membrane scaffolding protein for murein synthesis (MipA/OmpV family)
MIFSSRSNEVPGEAFTCNAIDTESPVSLNVCAQYEMPVIPNRLLRPLGTLALVLFSLGARGAWAQTPSPLQDWQYSGGIILARLFEPDLPTWRTILGGAAEWQPIYDGAKAYRTSAGPVINIRLRDEAFFSTSEGFGYNFLRGDHYEFGAGLAYDLGRKVREDLTNLHGMGDISPAPVGKLYGAVVLSRKFPLILRATARQFIGGANGAVADLGVYMPLPGSSKTFVMFAGPSITLATRHYLQTVFGVTPDQSLASGHPAYDIHDSGTDKAGVGFSATKFVTTHFLVNLDLAISQLRGSPSRSPITEERTQRVLALSFAYQWEKK